MNAVEQKHKAISTSILGEDLEGDAYVATGNITDYSANEHAAVTKEVAVGFKEYSDWYGDVRNNEGTVKRLTTDELYQEFISSLTQ